MKCSAPSRPATQICRRASYGATSRLSPCNPAVSYSTRRLIGLLSSHGGTAIRYHFRLDGEYQIKVLLKRQLYLYIMGMGEPHQIDIRLDGVLIKRFEIGGKAKGMTNPESFAGNTQGDPDFEEYMHTADAGLEVRLPVKAGTHIVGVSFVRRFWEPEGVLQPQQRGFARTTNELYHGYPSIDTVTIAGPYQTSGMNDDSPSRRKIFVCRPKDAASEEPCARKILSTLAMRAYRRPVAAADVRTFLDFYKEGRADGSFDAGIQRGLERILAAPSFLFRIEREPANRVCCGKEISATEAYWSRCPSSKDSGIENPTYSLASNW